MSLSPKPVVGKRAFIVCAYIRDSEEVPRPKKPPNCPIAESEDFHCIIHIERWRWRKCGIRFAIAGMRCRVHKLSFTVYPPGWVPYGRRALIPLDHNGSDIESVDSDDKLSDSLFAAAADAAKEDLWPEEVQLGPGPEVNLPPRMSRRTQRRHVRGAMLLFGLAASSTPSDREVVSRALDVALIDMEEGFKKIREGPTLVRKGLEAVRVLEKFQAIRLRMAGLLTLGRNQGFWGPALLH